MAKEDRATLEEIAVEIIIGSMQYMDRTADEIRAEAGKLTDSELVDFITA